MLRLSERYPKKRVWITGAASGLGLSLARQFVNDGWKVAMMDFHETRLIDAVSSLRHLNSSVVVGYVGDVRDLPTWEMNLKDWLNLHHGIDVWINNAGIGEGGEVGTYTIEAWRRMIDINLMGVIHGCHLAVPLMKKEGKGCLINIASAAAFAASAGMAAYNVAKAGVLSLSETLMHELHGQPIQITVVMPYFFKSHLMQHLETTDEITKVGQRMIQKASFDSEKMASVVLQRAGLGRKWIVYPKSIHWVYRLKRWFPSLYALMAGRMWLKRDILLKRLNVKS